MRPLTTTPSLLDDLLQPWIEATPQRVAICYRDRVWTWSQWADRIDRLTGALLAGGVHFGDRIGFLDKNHPACLEVTFAAARVGATSVVLNSRLAGDELDYAITDSGITWLFCGAEFRDAIAASENRIGLLDRLTVIGGTGDDYEHLIDHGAIEDQQPGVSADDVCVVMYSSGTTGRPKGVMLTQANLTSHARNVGQLFAFHPVTDVNLVATPVFHVAGLSYALLGIQAGAPTIMTREPTTAALLTAIEAGATHTFVVPPILSAILSASGDAVAGFGKLRCIGYGAAPMPLPVLRQALTAWPGTDFIHVYGQTEFAGVVTALSPADHRNPRHPERLLSVGKPVPGAQFRVVDPATETDITDGSRGELWFSSPQQTIGYLNRPDDTAATITPDGWLRTGDLGRVDDDGYIYIEDRIKDMIITGGENVYSPEVERVLLDHPAIADAAVFGIPDDQWGESVMAVIVPTPGAPPTVEHVIDFARQHLAAYKCPRHVEFLDAIPRNASGKILKRELREPYWRGHDRSI